MCMYVCIYSHTHYIYIYIILSNYLRLAEKFQG